MSDRTARYDLYNGLQHVLSRRGDLEFVRMRYEDVVASPADSLRRLAELGRSAGSGGSHSWGNPGSARLGENHLVDGNPVRFQHGQVRLEPDLAWQHALGPRQTGAVATLTVPLLRAYGYSISAPTAVEPGRVG